MAPYDYWSGYSSEPIGGGNPYYQCAGCGVSDPEINGDIDKHKYGCSEVEKHLKERRIEQLEERIEELEKQLEVRVMALERRMNNVENQSSGMMILGDQRIGVSSAHAFGMEKK